MHPTERDELTADFRGRLARALEPTYRLGAAVGSGGMAFVYRAERTDDGRPVAVKVVRPVIARALGHDRFRHEVDVLRRLDHPAIAPVLDQGEDDDLLYLIMPFLAGPTLRARLADEGQLAVPEAVAVTRTLLDALGYAHRSNVVHRDVKPENILFDGDRVVLTDFGIARAIIRSGGDGLSSTGVVLGTPSYMSPEQAAGEGRIDGRADLYSVGCVLFEMLAGVPPFTGPSHQVIQSRHLHEPPPDLTHSRPTAGPGLADVVRRALAKAPADRFPTAEAFAEALGPASLARPRRRTGRLAVAGVATAAVLAAAALLWPTTAPALSADRYVVLPFRDADPSPSSGLTGSQATRLVWRQLSRWEGLDLVDEALVEDRLHRRGAPTPTLEAGREVASSLGAGRLVWGEVVPVGDSVEVRAALYGGSGAVPIRRAAFMLAAAPAAGAADRIITRVRELVGALLADDTRLVAPGPLLATSVYPALVAALQGDSALLAWDLDAARRFYRVAMAADPGFAAPKLRYARASLWGGLPDSEWGPVATAALAAADQLGPAELLEARGLDALARHRHAEACGHYRALVAADSLNFSGWFGLAECQLGDDIVVRDAASPSGWRFRGEFLSGLDAYQTALRLVPYSHRAIGGAAASRLAIKVMAQSNGFRLGRTEGSPQPDYAALPSVEGDTLAFVPWPIDEVLAGRRTPPSSAAATRASRQVLLSITSAWLEQYPDSPEAIRAHAFALELAGVVDEPGGNGALGLLRSLTGRGGDLDHLLAAAEVRLLLKARRFTEAGRLATRLLEARPSGLPGAEVLPPLAALVGRTDLAATLAAAHGPVTFIGVDGIPIDGPLAAGQTARRLLAYAAAGGPADSLEALDRRLRQEVRSQVEVERQPQVEAAFRLQSAQLAFPLLAPPADTLLPISRIERALARGDTAAARAEFRRLDAARSAQLPGDVVPEYVVLEARLLALLGDSAAARTRLDGLLADLRILNPDVLDWVPSAAAIGRAMELRLTLGGPGLPPGLDTALAGLRTRTRR